ncbi:MAG: 2,3-bisphosphoglycerate-independent phosphoglycerate mutase [Candidatus Woesearchaeota archaeon]
MKHKTILVIRDGWGYRKECTDNAICEMHLKNDTMLMQNYPHTLLAASGEAVGVPKGYQGNSEVGHMTIGSGRIIFQSLERINKSIKDGDFFSIPEFLDAIKNCKQYNTTLHLIGLLQVEGVHSHRDHLFALLDLCKQEQFTNVVVHVITDGRDSPVTDSLKHIAALEEKFKQIGFGNIATISGRYYTMDRDKRWDRIKEAYECIVNAKGVSVFTDVTAEIKQCHANNETDEFIKPRARVSYTGIHEHDSIIFYNFRTDRPREFTQSIVEEKFDGWDRKALNVYYASMTQYYIPMNAHVAFKDVAFDNLLGKTLGEHGLKQLRISETEKYAHVTFFFNGQIEEPNPQEDRILIPSPKIATYDLKPEMSVYEVTERLKTEIATEKYDLIITNLVNGDMVGHTGVIDAIHKAVVAVDEAVGKIVEAGLAHNYTLIIFADHGNAEDQTPEWRTSHTINPVPGILVSNDEILKQCTLKEGKGLRDIAPTVLELLEIPKPKEMTGESLIQR